MKNRFLGAGALALAIIAPQLQTHALTNGVIMISTRAPQDTQFGSEFVTDEKGPGMVTPGDVAMADVLSNHGYSCRLILDRLLGAGAAAVGQDPANFLSPSNPNFGLGLIIMSGSGASADTPPPPPGVPVMMGEHVCLGNNAGRPGSVYMYKGTASSDPNEATAPAVSKYMKVLAPNHPIMQGIPVDAQGRVKIFREPFAEEEAHVPATGKRNFEFRWCTQAVADRADGTTILGVLDGAEDRACFAVADTGGLDANGAANSVRKVHLFLNENGSGGTRRGFLALTEFGRILFLRSAKWAMGEKLDPYQTFKILEVTPAGAQAIKVSWESSQKYSYYIQGSTDLKDWKTLLGDYPGRDGVLQKTLNIAAGPRAYYLRVDRIP